jgi:hypothetical protein
MKVIGWGGVRRKIQENIFKKKACVSPTLEKRTHRGNGSLPSRPASVAQQNARQCEKRAVLSGSLMLENEENTHTVRVSELRIHNGNMITALLHYHNITGIISYQILEMVQSMHINIHSEVI